MHMFLFFVAMAIFLVIAMLYSWQLLGRQHDAWRNAADILNLDFDGSDRSQPTMHGIQRGRRVHARVRVESAGKNEVSYTVVSAELEADCWHRLELSDHGVGDSVSKFFGGQDYSVGDNRFDSEFRIKSGLNTEVRRCLQDERAQRALRQMARWYSEVKIDNGFLEVECITYLTCETEVIRRVARVVDAAEQLDEVADGEQGPAWEEERLFPDPDDHSRAEPERQPESAATEVW